MGLAPCAAPQNRGAVEAEQPHPIFLPPSPGHLETSTPSFRGMTVGVRAHTRTRVDETVVKLMGSAHGTEK